jgi:hypothetical protein
MAIMTPRAAGPAPDVVASQGGKPRPMVAWAWLGAIFLGVEIRSMGGWVLAAMPSRCDPATCRRG